MLICNFGARIEPGTGSAGKDNTYNVLLLRHGRF